MEPFFFTSGNHQLYGVLHECTGTPRGRAVLMLYPLGQEYIRIHRAFRRLADTLADAGFDVLRFDYPATGDSSGSHAALGNSDCIEGAISAFDELQALAPNAEIDVVALRFGTVVARHLARQRDIARLVLWEPSFNDGDYLAELEQDIRTRGPSRANFIASDGTLHYGGYAFSRAFRDELAACSWQDWQDHRPCFALSADAAFGRSDIGQHLGHLDAKVECVAGTSNWITVDSMGGLFFPEASLRAISDWLST